MDTPFQNNFGIPYNEVFPPQNQRLRQTNKFSFLLKQVVCKLCQHENAWLFIQPTNPKQMKIPNYYEIIKHPMDLSTVKKRLKNFFYRSASEAITDINLIFKNAYKLSKPDGAYYAMAESLENRYLYYMRSMPKKEIEMANAKIQQKNQNQLYFNSSKIVSSNKFQ